MTTIDIINLISSIASLTLSVIAIWLSLYFYNQTKTSERNVSDSLSSIKSQTDTLQKLTARWMDRLTRYATDSSSYDSTLTQLIEVIKIIPGQNNIHLPQLESKIEDLTQEAISGYIGMHHYCAIANVVAQAHLPKLMDYDPTSEAHELIKNLLDNSFNTFNYLNDLLSEVDSKRIKVSSISSWYDMTNDFWKGSVKNANQVFEDAAA